MTGSNGSDGSPQSPPTHPGWRADDGQIHHRSRTDAAIGPGRMAACVVGLLVVGVAYLSGQLTAKRQRLEQQPAYSLADSARLPSIHDALAVLEEPAGVEAAPDAESRHCTMYDDGSRAWVYDYEDEETEPKLSLYCVLHVSPTESQARDRYLSWRRALDEVAARAGKDSRIEDHNRWFGWGQQWRCGQIVVDEEPVGAVFVARRDKTVFYFELQGRTVSHGETLASLLRPYLSAAERDFR